MLIRNGKSFNIDILHTNVLVQDRVDLEHSAIEGSSPSSADAVNEDHDSKADSPPSPSTNLVIMDPPLNIEETDLQSLSVATIANAEGDEGDEGAEGGIYDSLSIIEGGNLWPMVRAAKWNKLIAKFVLYF